MGYEQAFEMLDLMGLLEDIKWHLQYNLYPAIASQMIPVAVKAIMLCREGKFSENLLIPFEDRMGWMVPAFTVVETYDLQPWVNKLEMD